MKKIIYILSLIVMPAIFTNCVSDSEFDDLKKKLEKNKTDMASAKQVVLNVKNQFDALTTLSHNLDNKFKATAIEAGANGAYTIKFKGGADVTLNQAFNPIVEVKEGGFVWINGKQIPDAKVDGISATISLTIDAATGNYNLNYNVGGVAKTFTTNVKPQTGAKGDNLNVEILPDGTYKIGGVVQPQNIKPIDGKAPDVKFVEDAGKFYMVIKAIDDTETRQEVTPIQGDKGDQGDQARNGMPIQSIIVDKDQLVFTYTDGSTKKSQLVPLPLILNVDAPVQFTSAANTQTVNYTLISQTTNFSASVDLYKVPEGWTVKINKTGDKAGTVEITATADAVDGALMLMAIDDKDNNYLKRIELTYVP